MNDNLLERADRAIRDNRFVREQRRLNLMQARAASARIKAIVQWAHADQSRSRQVGLEMAEMIAQAHEHPTAKTASATSEQT